MNLLQQFVNFLVSQKGKSSFSTIKNYKADVGQFINWFERELNSPFDPSKITLPILEQYKKSRSLSPNSIERHISSLRKFFIFLKFEGIISEDPLEKKTASAEARALEDPWKLRNFKSFLYEYKKSNLTIKNYINDIKSFFLWLNEVSLTKYAWDLTERNLLDKINFSLVAEYKQRLIAAKFSPRTINRKLSSLRNYINWAKNQGIIPSGHPEFISPRSNAVSGSPARRQVSLQSNEMLNSSKRTFLSGGGAVQHDKLETDYSSFPPIRLMQKSLKGANLLFDNLFILPLAQTIDNIQYLFWKATGKKIFKKGIILNKVKNDKVLNIQKDFYAPLNVSTRYFPGHKRVWHYLHHVRPNWYKKYHSYSFTHYLHLAILIILASTVGFGMYNSLFADVQKENAILGAFTNAPPRILSFQGKLSDSQGNPIIQATTILFSIYNQENVSGATLLWQETDSVKPDSDGIFSILLGKNNPIPDTLFSQNPTLFLGITVGNGPELRPRQQLATVTLASNAQTLQGLEPITNTAKVSNVVLALDSSGNLSIAGSKAHTFQVIGGQFVLSGSILSLTTVPGSNSRVEIVPDGVGKIDLSKPIQNSTNNNNLSGVEGAVEFDDMVAILATTSAQSAFYINQNSTGPLISASTSGTAKFVVENDGTGIFSGDLGINGGNLTSTATTFNLLNSAVTTLNFASAAANLVLGATTGTITIRNASAAIQGNVTLGDATTDTLTFTGRVAQDSDLLPITTSGTNDLGSSSLPWDNAYIDNIYSALTGTSGHWQRANGSIIPTNITDDLLIGATSTSSAKFGFINVAGGNPTATISSNLSLIVPTGNAPANTFNLLNNGNLNIQRSPGGDGGLTTALFVQNSGNVGIGTTAPTAPFEVKGSGTGATIAKFTDNNTTGCTLATGGTISCSSDIRLKKNFENISYGLDAIMALKPIAFNWKSENDDTTKNLGFIAQEVEQIIPKLVTTDSNGFKQLNTIGFVPVLTKAFQEQQAQITSLSAIVKDINLTSTGDLKIVSSSKYQVSGIGNKVSESSPILNTYYLIRDTSEELIERFGAFSELAVANIKAGFIKASQVTTSSLIVTSDSVIIGGQNLKDYIARVIDALGIKNQESGIISPVVRTQQLATNIISPLAKDSNISISLRDSQFIIRDSRDASGSAVATIDSQGNASFSGQLQTNELLTNQLTTSEASISGILRARSIIADSISGFIDIASFSAQLSYVPNLQAEQGLFNQGLMVFGPTSLSDLSIAGNLSIGGTMFVTQNSIEALATDLSLQSLRQGGLSIMGGLVYIDTQGNLKAKGDVSILGKLAVNVISPLPTSDLVINNASGSGVLSINQKGDVVASGSGTFSKLNLSLVQPALAVSATEVIASSSAGTAKISPYQTEVTIRNALVTDKSVIYITPVGTPSAQTPFLMRQLPNEPVLSGTEGSFTVGVESPTRNPIPFNWLIVN